MTQSEKRFYPFSQEMEQISTSYKSKPTLPLKSFFTLDIPQKNVISSSKIQINLRKEPDHVLFKENMLNKNEENEENLQGILT